MSDGSEWISWVGPARAGDREAVEKLEQYFAPFVHAVVLSRVAHHQAGRLVKPVLTHAVFRLSMVPNDAAFGFFVLTIAREKATEAARAPGAMTERPANDPLVNSALQLLAKIRLLAEGPRERVLMRLLEGVSGGEIAQVIGAKPAEVRAELERATASLVQQLTSQSVSFAADNYLWSLVGAPHPALIPLENQLTALRYDETASADPDATPSQPGAPLPPRPEGRRPTAENIPVVKTTEATEPSGGSLNTIEMREARPVRNGPSGLHRIPAVAADPVNNPFGTSVKTIGVADLPAAADFADLQSTAPGVVEPPPEASEDFKTEANPVPIAPARVRGTSSNPKLKMDTGQSTAIRPTGVRPAAQKPPDSNATAISLTPVRDKEEEEDEADGGKTTVPVRKSGAWRNSHLLTAPLGLPTVAVEAGSVTRSWRPFAVAGVFALIAVGVALLLFDGTTRRVRSGWTLIPVIVAASDINEGALVSVEMISERAVPEQFVTSSVIKPDGIQYVIGQKLLVPVQAGDPLLWSQFESSRASEKLANKVVRHARAFDLMTGGLISVGGWVRPNDHIDIIANVKANTGDASRVAITLLQDVTVLSTGKRTSSTPDSVAKTNGHDYVDVSLLLLPEEAEIIALADKMAELQFTLRTDDDHDVLTDHRGSTSKTLLEGERVRLLQLKRFKTIQQIRSAKPTVAPKP